jgi:hypothetical protein
VSKPFTPKVLFPAIFLTAVAILAVAAICGSAFAPLHSQRTQAPLSAVPASPAQKQSHIRGSMDALPLAFEANQGQTDPQVKYLARASGYTVFLTNDDAVFSLHSGALDRVHASAQAKKPAAQVDSVMRLHLVGGNAQTKVEGVRPLAGKSNYFIGNDPNQWHTNVAQYSRVAYENVYPGVNLVFYGAQRQLEFDFIVAPGANTTSIQLSASGANHISRDESGNLVLAADAGSVTLHKPVAYQEKNGQREPVDARFVLAANSRISFELGAYDHSRELVIDPSVAFATFLGGSAEDDGYGIALDSSGNAYVTGQTQSTNFPGTSGSNAGGFDAFVAKISADGSTLLYSTYVGGSGNDSGTAIAVDSNGDAFVAGGTGSGNFPFTAGSFQTSLNGTVNAFVFELDPNGSALTYCTYLGGSDSDSAGGIALDSSGDAYVVGGTTSADFPVTANVVQGTLNGGAGNQNGFVTKLNPTGTSLLYSTYLGGGPGDTASAVAVDAQGDAYVTGETFNSSFPVTSGAFQTTCGTATGCNGGLSDAFVSVINPTGSQFVYSTFLGGEAADNGLAIAVDSAGDAYVAGFTLSAHFPTKSPIQPALTGSQDAFVTELNPSGSALVFSTYLGGGTTSGASGIAVDSGGDVYVTGSTASSDFPTTTGAPQTTFGGGIDAFLTEIVPNSTSFYFSTFLGGAQNENSGIPAGSESILGAVAVDPAGANIYLTGNTASGTNPGAFPTTTNAEQLTYGGGATDVFIAKYTQATFTIAATTPAAVSAGSSGMSTVTLDSLNGYNSSVNLTCAVTGAGTPAPQCSASSFSANPVTPTSGGATATLTITTTGPTAFARSTLLWLPAVALPLAGIVLLPARRRKNPGYILLALVLATIFLLPACGGSSSGGGGGGGGSKGTPSGNYTVTITGTDANQVTRSTQVMLTVN